MLVEKGFVASVRGRGHAPLFYGKPARGTEEGRHPSRGTANHFATWIREAGFKYERIAHAHGLKHYWKSSALDLGIPDSVADAIQGHEISGAADLYRHVTVRQMADAVARFPVPQIEAPAVAAGPVVEPAPAVEPARRVRRITFGPS